MAGLHFAHPGPFHTIRRVLTLGSRFTRHGRAGGAGHGRGHGRAGGTAGRPDRAGQGPSVRLAGQGRGQGGQGRGKIKSKR
jgi:hypothetical protein